jgi:hypothetical protein
MHFYISGVTVGNPAFAFESAMRYSISDLINAMAYICLSKNTGSLSVLVITHSGSIEVLG